MLNKEFYLQLLDLEEKVFNQKTSTLERINSLVDKYAQCVEFFDTISNPIKIYFLEKIQITLASTKFLNILVNSNEQSNQNIFSRMNSKTQNNQEQNNYQNEQNVGQTYSTTFYAQVKQSQQKISDQQESKDKRFQEAHLTLYLGGVDEIINEQIETQPTERGEEHENIQLTEIIDDESHENLTQLLKNEICYSKNYQRPFYLHQRGQFSGDYSEFASYCNSMVQVDSKTQSIINHLHQDILSPKNTDDGYDERKKKIERAKRVDLFMKVHAHKINEAHTEVNINTIIQDYEQSFKQNDELVKNDIQNQLDQIQEKLIRKKNKNQIIEFNKTIIDSTSQRSNSQQSYE